VRIARLVSAMCASVLLCIVVPLAGSAATSANVGWGGFGGTPDQNRHSPLTLLDKGNVAQLGRIFSVDFRKIDPAIFRGTQSYPIAVGDKLYVTTNDDSMFAVQVPSGNVVWRWKPDDTAVFTNFGIRANRGAAYCDGKLFELTLDMTIVEIDPSNGQLIRRVPISSGVPGASANVGYSETSAPMCADHKVVFGAAGSEYGVRGFVMAFRTSDLRPAWPNPFWTIPPTLTSWRKRSRIIGGGVVWTPVCIDTKTNSVFFGTGSATPLYFKDLRPGSNPRSDSLIALNLDTGKLKWWQQQMSSNEWAYDTAQPPLVYNGGVGGKKLRVVSVGTMEGVWFAYDARTGRPIYQRVKVIDRTEHPPLQAGKPVVIYPSALGGLNFSPASYDPATNYIFNAASETAAIFIKQKLTPQELRQKLVLGDVFLGLQNGDFGQFLPGWHDHGSLSAIDVNTGKQVWKVTTPEPERGGVATTASGLGFAGGGDGVLRAFDLKTGQILWKFQTGAQIAAGASIFEVDGKEYVAISSGGTPTSSNGGTATTLQVFGLGGSQAGSPPPALPPLAVRARSVLVGGPAAVRTTQSVAVSGKGTAARIRTPGLITVRPWNPNVTNEQDVTGTVTLAGKPVAGAIVRVDNYFVPARTRTDGTFAFSVDDTVAHRYQVTVADTSKATAGGRLLSAAGRAALKTASAGFDVGYAVKDLSTKVQADGTVLVTGRLADTAGNAPPLVSLYTYELSGAITDASGKPVQGAVVVTRTQDRNFWTYSSATNAQGHYSSFFAASDQAGDVTVPLTVQVALGGTLYSSLPATAVVNFHRLQSATMNVTLPASGTALPLPTATSFAGAVYDGLVVGAVGPKGVIKPVAERWPDARGVFSFVLPSSARRHTITLWESERRLLQTSAARPGGPVDVSRWPTQLGRQVTQRVAAVKVR
jgi:alcohol dehydrogenase (cytochrome c)